MSDLLRIEKGYSLWTVNGIEIQAKKSDGGGWYFIILPNGERLRHTAEVFERMAKRVEASDGNRPG